MKNPRQSPLCRLSCRSAYTQPPSHPVVIMIAVHAAATRPFASLNHIHIEYTVNPTYRSTRDTIPHGFDTSHWTCVELSGTPPVDVVQRPGYDEEHEGGTDVAHERGCLGEVVPAAGLPVGRSGFRHGLPVAGHVAPGSNRGAVLRGAVARGGQPGGGSSRECEVRACRGRAGRAVRRGSTLEGRVDAGRRWREFSTDAYRRRSAKHAASGALHGCRLPRGTSAPILTWR